MAPIQVIDLTSSPEPDDTPARVAALSRFQPRKQKTQVGYGLPTIPVNGLPHFYDDHEEQFGNDNTRRSLQNANDFHGGARAGSNSTMLDSITPTVPRENVRNSLTDFWPTTTSTGAAASRSPLNTNGTSIEVPELSSHTGPQMGLVSSLAPGRTKDAPTGTPIGYTIKQDVSKYPSPGSTEILTTEDPVQRNHQHTKKKNEVCAICSKAFSRIEKMQRHRQRCETRSNMRLSSRTTAPAPQRSSLPAAIDRDSSHGDSAKVSHGEGAFNALKRSLPSPNNDHQVAMHPLGAVKRARVDPTSPKPQQQPRSSIQLIDMTDNTMESFYFSDQSDGQAEECTHPEQQAYNPELAHSAAPQLVDDLSAGPSRNGLPYTPEEDALLTKLKEVDRVPFPVIVGKFSGRTQGSLTVRYYTVCKRKGKPEKREPIRPASTDLRSQKQTKRIRKTNVADGMVPWASVKEARLAENEAVEAQRERKRRKHLGDQDPRDAGVEMTIDEAGALDGESEPPQRSLKDSAYPSSMSRILRLREMGVRGRRAWSGDAHPVPDELKDHIFSSYELLRDYQGTSGDVISLAWNDNGRFAASSIAIADQQSMQYNMHRNLLVGDTNRGEVKELLEHHIPRPLIESTSNINANSAMRASQDPRLFLSVVSAKFCPQDGTRLFTAGMDKTVRHFSVEADEVVHRYSIEHTAPVTLLAVGEGHGLVATGCHQPTNNINIFQCDAERYEVKLQLSPRQATVPVSLMCCAARL